MAKDYSMRTTPTFLDALMMTANAIPDASLVIDGSDCVYEQPDRGLNKHDWFQTLRPTSGNTRLLSTGIESVTALLGTETHLEDRIRQVIERSKPGMVIVAQLALMKLMGNRIEDVVKRLSREFDTPIIPLESHFIERDYLDGFKIAFEQFADHIKVNPDGPHDKVALIGYPFTRNEYDDIGDVAVLKDMLQAVGMQPGPLWFSNQSAANLLNFAHVGQVLSLPMGHTAGKKIQTHFGLSHLELPLPLGLAASEDFMRRIGSFASRVADADSYIDKWLKTLVPRLEWVIPRFFLARRVVLIAEPTILGGLSAFLKELGFEIVLQIVRTRKKPEGMPGPVDRNDPMRAFDPSFTSLRLQVAQSIANGGIDLVIGSSWERDALVEFGLPFFELGYPSIIRHCLDEQSVLGFHGALKLVDQLVRLLAETDYVKSRR
jgi:nitrogenase molybdenum-iron protein alpha/beta subunit